MSNEREDYQEYLLERLFGTNPFDGWTEEEIEEYQQQLNGDFDEDDQRNGRF
jgi:hypothetical protein